MRKNVFRCFLIAMIALAVFSCKKDGPVIEKGSVEFGFNLKELPQSKIKFTKEAAEPAAIVVSIADATGTLVYDTEEVGLYNMNGYFISKPLSLTVGSYTVEKFLVVDAGGEVIYASPLEGSELAYLENDPLPIDFTVSKDEVLKLVPEVLSTENLIPKDFGYTTFSFDVVETFDFLIGVFVYNEAAQNFELTDAYLSIKAEGNSIYSDTLAAITNQIKVNDGFDTYILTVEKENYTSYVDTFTNAELKLYFSSEDNGPLVVILEDGTPVTGQPCPGAPTVTDADGNVYPTVQIGDQCWMAENLKTTKYKNGTDISLITDNTIWSNLSTSGYCWYNNDQTSYGETYGALYNWYAVETGSLCPTGWHVPTDTEWTELTEYLGSTFAGGKLKETGTTHWAAPNTGANNVTGFTALPSGRRKDSGTFTNLNYEVNFWSLTEINSSIARYRFLLSVGSDLFNGNTSKNFGFSVRCIKN